MDGKTMVLTGEGRAVKDGTNPWEYEYDLKDHLGNNFNNQNSLEFKQMKAYLYYMKGWLGGTSSTTDKKLEQAFENEYLNNKRNVSGN